MYAISIRPKLYPVADDVHIYLYI